MRKLASIQKIEKLSPIPNADMIEVASVLGWNLVVKKGEFNVGDICVYFEVDSYLDVNDSRYEFLKNSSFRNNEFMGPGLRIKTITLRGCLSQGLALPVSIFPEIVNPQIGDDVTEILKVRKWEMPEMLGSSGNAIGDKPYGIPTTDETRCQSMDVLRQELLGKPYYISTKIDGTSCTIYYLHNKVGVCGRNNEYKNDDKSPMWKYFNENNIPQKLIDYRRNLIIQGEFAGPGIQKNRLKLKGPGFYVFNIMTDDMKLLPLDDMIQICNDLGLTHVPIEERGDNFNYTLEELLEKARGKYSSGLDKEGIVIRPITPFWSYNLSKPLSFKVLNNDFLKKEKD